MVMSSSRNKARDVDSCFPVFANGPKPMGNTCAIPIRRCFRLMACLRWIICTAITIPWIALAEPVYDSEPNEIHLVILHTKDIHGHMTSWQGWEGDLAGKTIGGFDRLATA